MRTPAIKTPLDDTYVYPIKTEEDREALRKNGFNDQDIWDISAVASFFNMSNRMSLAIDLMPNTDYHAKARV